MEQRRKSRFTDEFGTHLAIHTFYKYFKKSLPVSDAQTRVCMICATPQPR